MDLKIIIKNISDLFQNDELAYLTLTSKIELQLRDKIAFALHQQYHDKYLICREWKSPEHKNHRVDLAIIEIGSGNPVCLFEFKAKSVVRYEKEFTNHIKTDLKKISKIATDDSVELYYIYFNTILNAKNQFESIFRNSVKYIPAINKNIKANIESDIECKTNWERHIKEANLDLNKSSQLRINGGKYYGFEVGIETFIYGPIRKSDLNSNIA